MATLTTPEFQQAVEVLAQHYGLERMRDRLARLGAFQSRRGLNTAAALADRLHRLSGGLRLQVAATYAFTQLWTEMLHGRVGEEAEQTLEELAEKVNACLTPAEQVTEGKEADLDAALAGYRDAVAAKVGPEIARLDMLLKAVPAVAERLRAAPAAAPAEPPAPPEG